MLALRRPANLEPISQSSRHVAHSIILSVRVGRAVTASTGSILRGINMPRHWQTEQIVEIRSEAIIMTRYRRTHEL